MGNVRTCMRGRVNESGTCDCDLHFSDLKIDYANYQECYDCEDYEVWDDDLSEDDEDNCGEELGAEDMYFEN